MDTVSIIMPAYNSAPYIAETIRSVEAQTYPHWELWVVDDGSTDNTASLVKAFCEKDSRIHYLYQPNGRQGKARNLGLSRAQGRLIAFLDADDLWLPQKLEIQRGQLEKAGTDAVCSSVFVFQNRFDYKESDIIRLENKAWLGMDGFTELVQGNKIPILTVLATRESIEQAGGFSENPAVQNAEDYHLWLKLLLQGSGIRGYAEPLAAYRLSHTASTAFDKLASAQVAEVYHDLARMHPGLRKTIQPALKKTILQGLYQLSRQTPPDLFVRLQRYLQLAGASGWLPLMAVLRRMKNQKAGLRLAYFIINRFM